MAFGVKVKLGVEVVGGSKLRSQIQQAVENATQGKPIKIRHLSVDLGRQEAQRISKQLESAIASESIAIKIAKIDASKPVADLKKQLTTMLSGLSITGLKDFLGTDGAADSYDKAAAAANKLAEAQENVRKKTEGANASLKALKASQSVLNSAFKSATDVQSDDKLREYLSTYHDLLAAIEAAKNMQGEAQAEEVRRITAATAALKQKVAVQLDAEKAEKKQGTAAKDAESAVRRQATLAKQLSLLYQRIYTWTQKNPKAYAANKVAIEGMLASLSNGSITASAGLKQIDARFQEISVSSLKAGMNGKTFFDVLKAGWAKFGGWTLVTKSMMAAINAVKDMIRAVTDLDTAMTELRKVTDLSARAYSEFQDKAVQTAKAIGASVADTINATADFARLGFGIEDAASLAEAALVYKNVGDGIDDISIATESLISTIKAFGIEAGSAMSIVDMFNEVGNNFAISSSGIGDALQRSASALAAAGNTIEESIGLVTSMNSVVQDPDSVGTALKTLTMYLRAAKTEAEEAGLETEGMANSVSELRDELMSLTGVDIMIDDDTFKSTYQIVKEIANVWDSLTDVSRSNVLNLFGGKRNANVISSLITNFEDAEEAMKSAMDSMGSAAAENEKYLDSIAGKIAIFKASFEDLSKTVVDSELVKAIIDFGTGVVDVLKGVFNFIDAIGGLKTAILGVLGVILTLKGHMISLMFAQSLVSLFGKLRTAISNIAHVIPTAITAWKNFTFTATASNAAIQASIPVIGLALTAITAIVSAITFFTSKSKEAEKSIHDLKSDLASMVSSAQSAAKEFRSLRDSAGDIIPRFAELSKGVNALGENVGLTDEQYNEFLDLNNQIAEMFPQLNLGMDSNGNAMLTLSYTADTLAESLWGVVEAQRAAANAELAKKMPEVVENLNSQMAAYKAQIAEVEKEINTVLELMSGNQSYHLNTTSFDPDEILKFKDEYYEYIELLQKYGIPYEVKQRAVSSTWWSVIVQDQEAATRALGEALDKQIKMIKDQMGSAWEELNFIVNAWAQTNALYDSLNDPMKEIATYMMSGLDFGALGLKTAEEVQDFVQGNIIAPLFNAGDDVKAAFAELINLKDMLKDGEISGDEVEAQLKEAFSGLFAGMSEERVSNLQAYFVAGLSSMGLAGDDFEAVLSNLITEWAKFESVIAGTPTGVKGLSDAISELQKGYDILEKARSDMESGGSLSADTISSIASMLTEGEKITDYLIYENGLLSLNEEAWKKRAESVISGNIAAIEEEISELEAANASLNEELLQAGSSMEAAWANGEEIAENEAAIAALNKELELYKAIYGEIADGDPTDLSSMVSELDGVGSKVSGLLDTLKGLEDGTALSAEEMAKFALEYEELLGLGSEYDLATLDGQRAAIQAVIKAYEDEFDAIIGTRIAALEAAKSKEGITEEELASLNALIAGLQEVQSLAAAGIYGDSDDDEPDKVKEIDTLTDAIGRFNTAVSLIGDIRTGDTLSVLENIMSLVDSGKFSISDFFDADGLKTDAEITEAIFDKLIASIETVAEKGNMVWNDEWTEALRNEMNSAGEEVGDTTDKVRELTDAVSDMHSALGSRKEYGGYTQITYEDYQKLIEADRRYAEAIEYQNGVMTLNSAKHDEITAKILEETRQMAMNEKQTILMSEAYQELREKFEDGLLTEGDDLQRYLDLEAQIQGYDVLAKEIDSATSAYYRWLNRKGDGGMDRYSQAVEALGLIDETLFDSESEFFGRIGRDDFSLAVDFVLGEHVEVNTPEFDRALELARRYLTEGAEGAGNFYDDLLSAGLLDETTRTIDSTLAEVARSLGISEEMARTMIDRINEYQQEASKIKVTEPEVETDKAETALEKVITSLESANGYIDEISNTPLVIAVSEEEKTAAGLSTIGETLETIKANIAQILQNPLAFNTDLLNTAVEKIYAYLTDIAKAFKDVNELELGVDSSESVEAMEALNTSAETVMESLTAISEILKAVIDARDSLNGEGIKISTGTTAYAIGKVSDALSKLLKKLQQIKANDKITIRINEITTSSTKTSGGWLSGIFGKANASGNAAVRGTAMAGGGNTLVGELGMETVVDPERNMWYTVGERGAEFVKLPENAIVFNHRQTEELFGKGRTDSRGNAFASGNAAAFLKNVVSKIQSGISGVVTGITGLVDKASDAIKNGAALGRPGGGAEPTGGASPGGASGGKPSKEDALSALIEKYEEINKQTEHLIAHQQFLYKEAENGLDYKGMEQSLTKQAELYRKIIADSQAAVSEMIAAGADDTDEELQAMEEAYWSAYDSLYNTLDQIGALYVDAINAKVDGIQNAYENLKTAADELSSGGISVDTFQALIENGVQYMSLLDNIGGQYVINAEGIERMIAAQKEQLAMEAALSYLQKLKIALNDKDGNAVAALVDMTEALSNSTWDAVYAQAALLKGSGGLTDAQYTQIIANIDALRAIAGSVNSDITKEIENADESASGKNQNQIDALEKILSLTEDLIKAESEERIEAIENEIDAYQKIIDLKKESLRQTKEENDYTKSVAEKTSEIANMQARIDQLKLDDSREARAERASLEKELASLQDELGSLQSDHSLQMQEKALDQAAQDYADARQKEIENIENSLSSAEKLYQAALERLGSGWDTLYEELIQWNYEAGSSLNSEITENWLAAAEAVKLYGSYLKAVEALKQGEDVVSVGSPVSNVVSGTSHAPKYHTGGIAGGNATEKDKEVLSVLEEGEMVLTEKMKKAAYRLIDFKDYIEKKLGTVIGSIASPIPQLPAFAGASQLGRGGVDIGQMNFSPAVHVEINHSGAMSNDDARQYGKTIADTAMNELYEGFRQRGIGKIFGTKPKQ